MPIATLPITGYRDERVPNTLLRQATAADHLAIILPGEGYGRDRPVLYYPSRLLFGMGADLLRVEYAYARRPGWRELPPADQDRWLAADVTAPPGTSPWLRPTTRG